MSPRALSSTFLRFETETGATYLALVASRGRHDCAETVAWARELLSSPSTHDLDAERAATDLPGLAELARLMAGRAENVIESADLHQALRLLHGSVPLGPDAELLDIQTNLAVGRKEYAARLVRQLDHPIVAWLARTELLNPHTGSGVDEPMWLAVLNEVFTQDGLTPVTLDGDVAQREAAQPFDRLHGAAAPDLIVEDGPLVTVIVPVFNRGKGLFTALRSLAAQTWRRMQVIVVDDCSDAEHRPLIERAVATDDRFELVRMPHNGGTYRARNAGLAKARGELIAFQDSDDWSHPDRLRRQILPILDDSQALASTSRALRVFPSLSVNLIGYLPFRRLSSSSLVFRRRPVLERLGGYDVTRKAADSEFTARIRSAFGTSAVIQVMDHLAMIQLSDGSLSRDDFRLGYHHWARDAYRRAYEVWHEDIAAGRADARLDPAAPRPFPAPAAILGDQSPRGRCDVLVVSDWRAGIGRYRGATSELLALADSPLDTHFLHAEAPRFARVPRSPNTPEVNRAHLSGRLGWSFWGSDVEAGLVLLEDPEILGGTPSPSDVRVTASRVVVKAGRPPRALDGGWITYHPRHVESALRSLFNLEPTWWPATGAIARALREEGAMAPMLDPMPWGVTVAPRRPFPGRPATGRAVVGTAGLDLSLNDPRAWAELVQRLPDDDVFDVRVHDPEDAIQRARRSRRLPPNWLVRGGDVVDLLWSLDVFVAMPSGAEPSSLVHDALATGCVVVADEALRPLHGDSVVYAPAGEVSQVVLDVTRDPGRYAEHQRRGWQYVDDHLTGSAFVRRIEALVDHTG